jgi:hypothetical protein
MSDEDIAGRLLGIADVTPLAHETKIERAMRSRERKIVKDLDITADTYKIYYRDPVTGNMVDGLDNAPKYVSLADFKTGQVKVNSDSVTVRNQRYQVTPRLDHDIDFDLHSPREHEARALWMEGKTNKFFTKAASVYEEDVGALDTIIDRLRRGTLKAEDFKDSKLVIRSKARGSNGSAKLTQTYDLTTELDDLINAHLVKKLELSDKYLNNRKNLPIPGTTSEKARMLREITGIRFDVTDGRYLGQNTDYPQYVTTRDGQISLSRTALETKSLADNLKILLHEKGHNVDNTFRYDSITTIDLGNKKMLAEAKKLSRVVRPLRS